MDDESFAADPLLAGIPAHEGYRVLGGVVLYGKLGAGGMGAVYRGRHLRLGLDVAVKVLTPPTDVPPSEAEDFVGRFVREAQVAAAINHPNLVRVMDVNTEHGLYFLIMDYIEGESAAERLERKGRLPEAEAFEICLGAAEGLAEAHRKGIVHRDAKPDNIMIDTEGKVRVMDLGLAKAYSAEPSMLTDTQIAIGTPHYMSPEQFASSRTVGPPADVWSLGVTLYELLMGQYPWDDSNVFALADKIRAAPLPDPREARPDLSDGMHAVIAKALSKEPEQRYLHCGEMAQALRAHRPALDASGESALVVPGPAADAPPPGAGPPDSQTFARIAAAVAGDTSLHRRASTVSTGEDTGVVPSPAPGRLPAWALPAIVLGGIALGGAIVLSSVLGAGRRPTPRGRTGAAAPGAMSVESSAFAAGARVPGRHTKNGGNVSPPLSWKRAPEGTKEFVIICDDTDAPGGEPRAHWVLYGISADCAALAEGDPGGAIEGMNSWGRTCYDGPAPPAGDGERRYSFRVYALDRALGLSNGAGKNEVLRAMRGRILAEGELVGTCGKE